jgi:hypothetical protein
MPAVSGNSGREERHEIDSWVPLTVRRCDFLGRGALFRVMFMLVIAVLVVLPVAAPTTFRLVFGLFGTGVLRARPISGSRHFAPSGLIGC